MWKIYLCGLKTKAQEGGLDWQERLKKEFKEKYVFVSVADSSSGEVMDESSSLSKFLPNAIKQPLISELSVMDEADIVVTNVTSLTFEIVIHLIYSNLMRKPTLMFTEAVILDDDSRYISSMADRFFLSYDQLVTYLKEMKTLPRLQRSQLRDIMFACIQKEIDSLFSKEDRKDALFRAAILASQLGQLLHYLTHDRQINPAARVVGSRADEEAQLGDCLVQLAMYSLSRNFRLGDIYSMGIRRMEETVWRSTQLEITPRELRPNEIGYGISASGGKATGKVVIVKTVEDASKISEGKCIVVVPEYTRFVWDEIAARIENITGLISGTGSPNAHPAIVCRELKKPCIVSAKELVERLKDGEIVTMEVGAELEDNTVIRTDQQ